MINPRFISEVEITGNNYRQTSIERARTLIVTKLYETDRHIAYSVRDPFKDSEHVVIYKSEKKPPSDWSCDCTWYTSKAIHTGEYCAHILAVHLKRKA